MRVSGTAVWAGDAGERSRIVLQPRSHAHPGSPDTPVAVRMNQPFAFYAPGAPRTFSAGVQYWF